MGLCDTHYVYFRRTGRIGQREVRSLEDRLWAKTNKTPGLGPNGDCWEWTGYRHPVGYGQIGRGPKGAGGLHTHRAAWEVTNGPIPKGKLVLHTCDNRLCVNPAHLWLGTHRDNTQDMIAKGRRRPSSAVARGEDVALAKLTEEMVRAMRAEPPMTFKELGEKYGVSTGTANKVILRRTWKHI
jgi:hypothetical protein